MKSALMITKMTEDFQQFQSRMFIMALAQHALGNEKFNEVVRQIGQCYLDELKKRVPEWLREMSRKDGVDLGEVVNSVSAFVNKLTESITK